MSATYFNLDEGFSFNEGGRWLNFHVGWGRRTNGRRQLFTYIFLFGRRAYRWWGKV